MHGVWLNKRWRERGLCDAYCTRGSFVHSIEETSEFNVVRFTCAGTARSRCDASLPTADSPVKNYQLSMHRFISNNNDNNCAFSQADCSWGSMINALTLFLFFLCSHVQNSKTSVHISVPHSMKCHTMAFYSNGRRIMITRNRVR